MNRKLKFFYFSSMFLFLVLFSVGGFTSLDPDFGWHLRSGEIILSNGIPYKDPFSYSMPSYNFVNHEWLTGVIIAKLYPLIGMVGLAIIFSVIVIASLSIQAFKSSSKYTIITIIPALTAMLSSIRISPQILTWLFFSILLKIILDKRIWGKWRFFLPLLFLLWVNLHGGFAIGIATLTLVVVLRLMQEYFGFQSASCNRTDIFILFFSIFATFLNPYGLSIWKVVWETISDTSLRFTIAEWMPSFFVLNFSLWFFFPFSLVMVLRYRKRFSFLEQFLYFALLLWGLSSIRNMPLWIIIAFPMTIETISYLSKEAGKFKDGALRFNKAYKVFFILVIFVSMIGVGLAINSAKALSEESYYPKKAVEFLKINKAKGKIFSTYNWGGYLTWKLPDEKVFINGAMTVWRQKAENEKESQYAFGEFRDITGGKIAFKDVSNKYNITTVVLPYPESEKKQKKFLSRLRFWWHKSSEKRKYPDIIIQLKADGWKEVYRNEMAIVYRK